VNVANLLAKAALSIGNRIKIFPRHAIGADFASSNVSTGAPAVSLGQ
jgi:hypothetical protein